MSCPGCEQLLQNIVALSEYNRDLLQQIREFVIKYELEDSDEYIDPAMDSD